MADYAFERINTVDSTNTELKRRINASFGMKTSVLIADEQTAGREGAEEYGSIPMGRC